MKYLKQIWDNSVYQGDCAIPQVKKEDRFLFVLQDQEKVCCLFDSGSTSIFYHYNILKTINKELPCQKNKSIWKKLMDYFRF